MSVQLPSAVQQRLRAWPTAAAQADVPSSPMRAELVAAGVITPRERELCTPLRGTYSVLRTDARGRRAANRKDGSYSVAQGESAELWWSLRGRPATYLAPEADRVLCRTDWALDG